MEFVYTARNLQIFTIKQVMKFPKRYTFYLGQQISNLATSIHDNVKRANSITPTNAHEVQLRRDLLLNARGTLYSMVSQIEVAKEVFQIDMNAMCEWCNLIDDEIKLVSGVLKNDKQRYKSLVEQG